MLDKLTPFGIYIGVVDNVCTYAIHGVFGNYVNSIAGMFALP